MAPLMDLALGASSLTPSGEAVWVIDRRSPVLGFLLTVALTVAGCGSDDAVATISTDSTSPTTTSSITASSTAASSTAASSTAASSTAAELQAEQQAAGNDDSSTSVENRADGGEVDAGTTSVCRRLTDFDEEINAGWFVVNDGVMGGRSNGGISFEDSTMRFVGTVVTDGGGFTSVRLDLSGPELADTSRIELRARFDGRRYGVTFEDGARSGRRLISHQALLPEEPPGTDGWTTSTVPYGELRPSIFGQPIDADPFDPDRASQIGIIIADGVDGDFTLELDWIDACT